VATNPPDPSALSVGAGDTASAGDPVRQSRTAGTDAGPVKRASRGSTLPIRGGKREVKAYALTEDELTTLGAIQGLAALFFSLGGTSFGIWLSIKLQLAFIPAQADERTKGYWEGLQSATKWVAIACAALGIGLFVFNYFRVRKIKKGTVH
jgi:hypothetical protein